MIYQGDCLDILKTLPDNSVDSMVTDPPAGIAFMGKSWDADKGGRDLWIAWMKKIMREALRVLKPGAHGLVWALPRASHWTATALEDAGFEVRDVVNHVFGSGFPKSLNISKAIDKMKGADREVVGPNKFVHLNGKENKVCYGKSSRPDETISSTPEAKQWDGYGTALKPAHENWILVRKPLESKTVAENILEWGCGGINIDRARISTQGEVVWKVPPNDKKSNSLMIYEKPGEGSDSMFKNKGNRQGTPLGRFPSNFILTEGVAVEELDRQSGVSISRPHKNKLSHESGWKNSSIGEAFSPHNDSGGASRFFYIAKASKKDKGELNSHPTVKNTKLMSYLITLVTPQGGTVLDPFMGSGSTGVAALRNGFQFIGIEKEPEYFEIAKARIGKAEIKQQELQYA